MTVKLIEKEDMEDFKLFTDVVDRKRVDPYIIEAQELDLFENIGYALYYDLVANYKKENIVISYAITAGGPFTLTESVSGGTGISGKVVSDIPPNGSNPGRLELGTLVGDWATATTITGGTSGTIATRGTISYGKYYNLVKGKTYTDLSGYTVDFPGLRAALCYWAFARFVENQPITITSHAIVTKTSPYSEPASAKAIAARITQARSGALAYFNRATKFLNDSNRTGAITYPLWLTCNSQPTKSEGGIRISTVDRDRRERTGDGRRKRRYEYGSSGVTSLGGGVFQMSLLTRANVLSYQLGVPAQAIAGATLNNIPLTPPTPSNPTGQYTWDGVNFVLTDPGQTIDADMYLNIFYRL